MFHKFFQWRHLRRRKSAHPALRGSQPRTPSRDLVQYVKDFAGKDSARAGAGRRFLRKIVKLTLACGLTAFSIWFVIESYKGLRLFD
ncbi:MAG: hypothetical protein CMI32_07025 [Opitutales bacterium]|nr:hypothetical protein [Opitutales bacterium]|tara:strand:- start:193 stop:453 length:261 start_codon:yes stop_codon:yes gene_type:complete